VGLGAEMSEAVVIDPAEYDECKVQCEDPQGDVWEQYLMEEWRKASVAILGVDEKDDLPW